MREERDLELELLRQDMADKLGEATAQYTTQYEAIQQSRERDLDRLRKNSKEECDAAGFEAACTDRFDDQV